MDSKPGTAVSTGAGSLPSSTLKDAPLTFNMTGLSGSSSGNRLSKSHSMTALDGKMKVRAPRPLKNLRYSPLVRHFITSQKFSSTNLVQRLKIALTEAEEHMILLDRKHSKLLPQAQAMRRTSNSLMSSYRDLHRTLKKEEKELAQTYQAKTRALEQRRTEVLRKNPHEFANFLVSLKLLQTE